MVMVLLTTLVSIKTIESLERYMPQLHILLINLYRHNSLSINADKTEYMNFTRKSKESVEKLTICDDKGNILKNKKIQGMQDEVKRLVRMWE